MDLPSWYTRWRDWLFSRPSRASDIPSGVLDSMHAESSGTPPRLPHQRRRKPTGNAKTSYLGQRRRASKPRSPSKGR